MSMTLLPGKERSCLWIQIAVGPSVFVLPQQKPSLWSWLSNDPCQWLQVYY